MKTTSMGDVVHTLPAVSDMARALPGLTVDWLVEAPFSAMPAMHPAVSRVIPLSWRKWRKALGRRETWRAMAECRGLLKAERFDAVIDFQGLLKSVLWARQASGPLCGYDRSSIREPAASFFYEKRAAVSRELHAVDRCRRLASSLLGYPLPTDPPDFSLVAPQEGWRPPSTPQAGALGSQPYAVLIPCASRVEKLWPVDGWRAIVARCEREGLQVVVLWGSPAEEQLARQVAAGSSALLPPFLTVREAAGLLAHAHLVVGLDTGFTHLAAAFARPTVGIYCDHEPGLAGVTGPGWVCSLGGEGLVPGLSDVEQAFDGALAAAGRR